MIDEFNLLKLLLSPILLIIWLVRMLRWLSWLQQKEYRLDRMRSFIGSREGRQEIWRLSPTLSEFSRKGLKRPVMTIRIMMVAVLALIFQAWLFGWIREWGGNLVALVLMVILVPLSILLVSVPIAATRYLIEEMLLRLAYRKVRRYKPTVIGITGSYGKTSTKLILSHVLRGWVATYTTPGSRNTPIAVAIDLIKHYRGESVLILELAAYRKGEIARLANLFRPEIAIITGITYQHTGLFGSIEKVLEAKAELLKALSPTGKIVANRDDAEVRQMVNGFGQDKICFGKKSKMFRDVRLSTLGRLEFVWEGQKIKTRLVGRHYLYAIMAVIEVALEMGVSKEKIARGLGSFRPTERFIRSYRHKQGYIIIDDGGTANPKGVKAAIELVKEMRSERKIMMFAGIVDIGAESSQIHGELAKIAETTFDMVWYTGMEGREEFEKVMEDKVMADEGELVEMIKVLSRKDMILIEGRIPSRFREKLKALEE